MKLRESHPPPREISKAEFMEGMKAKLLAEEKRLAKREAAAQRKREKDAAERRRTSPLVVAPVLPAGPKFIS